MDKPWKDIGKMNIVDWTESLPQKNPEREKSEDFITVFPTQNPKKIAFGLTVSVCAGHLLGK